MDGARPGPRPARHHADRPQLADRGPAADAAEQPRPRGRRAARRPGRLRRHRPGGARLAQLRRDGPHAAPRSSDDETMLVQSGRPVGVMRTHEWAPRVLIANSNLVGDWATWPEFRRLEHLGLTMYGQMTAGSWIYIGTQGILQGTYETFAAVAAKRFGGTLAGTLTAHRRLRRHGRRAAAGGHAQRRRLPDRRRRRRPGCSAASTTATSTRWPTTSTTPSRAALAAKRDAPAAVDRRGRQLRRPCCPSCCAAASRSTSSPTRPRAHDPLSLPARGRRRSTTGTTTPQAKPEEFTDRARASMAKHVEAMVGFLDAGAEVFDYGNSIRDEARQGGYDAGLRLPRLRARLHPAAVLRGQGPVPLGGAVRRPEGHRRAPTRRCSTCSPTTTTCTAGSARPRRRWPSRACRPGSAGSATASATRPGCAFNELVASGEISAPIVIGRDHLDCRLGRLALPRDRGDGRRLRRDRRLAAAQRAGQHRVAARPGCRSTTAAASASAARSTPARSRVADGTALAAQKLERVLTQRPRHGRDPARRRRLRPRRRRSADASAGRCRGARWPTSER